MRQNHESHKMTLKIIAGYNGNRPRRWRQIVKLQGSLDFGAGQLWRLYLKEASM
jgi:hypothetical protein